MSTPRPTKQKYGNTEISLQMKIRISLVEARFFVNDYSILIFFITICYKDKNQNFSHWILF